MAEEVIETVENENGESVIIGLLKEIQSSVTMLTEQITALTPVQDEEKKDETDEKVEVEPEGTTDDTTEELTPEEVEKMLFEN